MIGLPQPRAAVLAPTLARPDWTKADGRDSRRLWLDKNENSDPELRALVARVLSEVAPQAPWSYPDSAALYHKLARHVGAAPENLLLACGSDGVIRSVFEAYVAPGDMVIHTDPTFAMYGVYSAIYGARVRTTGYRRSNHGPVLLIDELLSAIRAERPRLVCLPNPDSPTGTIIEHDVLEDLIEAAGAAGAVVLIDEAYFPFYPHTIVSWIDRFPHLVVARSTGKAWGMAGLRIGYGVAGAALTAVLHKVRPMYEASTVAVAVFERMLDHVDAITASVRRLEEGKRAFADAMKELGFATHVGHGNFVHVGFGAHAETVHAALANLVYYRKGFAHPSLSGYSRFSTATAAQFAPVIERIRSAIGARS